MDKQNYLSFTVLHDALPLFYQPWWLDAVCKDWDLAAIGDTDGMRLVFPYAKEKKSIFTLLRSPLLTPYLGPIFLPNVEVNADKRRGYLEQLWEQLPKADFFQFQTVPEFQDFEFFHRLGFTNHAKVTYYVDLQQSETTLFDKIQSRRRSYIRNASKTLRVAIDENPDLPVFHQWHKRAFEEKGKKYPYTLAFLEKVIAAAKANASSLFLTAKDNQELPVAMLWTPFDQSKAYHLLGAYDNERAVNGAMDLLVWEAMKILKNEGKVTYDFEGSMDPGIAAFFRKFGGERRQYFNFEQTNSVLLRVVNVVLNR